MQERMDLCRWEWMQGFGHVCKSGKKLKGGGVKGEGEGSGFLVAGPGEHMVLLVTTECVFVGSEVTIVAGEVYAIPSDVPALAELDVASDRDKDAISNA